MNIKKFVNSMKTEEDKEWANRAIEMALSLRQQKTLRASYSRELYNKRFKEINFKGEKLMIKQEITNLENAIKEYFDVRLGIMLEDSPQILNEYIYLEFEDRQGNNRKIRARYKQTSISFLSASFDSQIRFLLEEIVRDAYGM